MEPKLSCVENGTESVLNGDDITTVLLGALWSWRGGEERLLHDVARDIHNGYAAKDVKVVEE